MAFNFAPTVVVCIGYRDSSSFHDNPARYSNDMSYAGVDMRVLTTSYQQLSVMKASSSPRVQAKKSSDGKTLYWKSTDSSSWDALNNSSNVYLFLGIA